MNVTAKLGVYGGVLAASFAIAAGIGSAVGPIDTDDEPVHHEPDIDDDGHGADGRSPASRPGTSLDAGGFRLVPDAAAVAAEQGGTYSFTIVDEQGHPVTEFDQLHERDLHLVVASRDLDTYHHLHPQRDGGGRWSVDLPSLPEGSYRVYADAAPTGADPVTLGHDLAAAEVVTTGYPPPVVMTSSVDGFVVTMYTAVPGHGAPSYEFTVERHGERVTPEPYLGALGHLVALRSGDLAYVHVHATETSNRSIGFGIDFPTPGPYRLFLDFSVDGTVHTADFTVDIAPSADDDTTGGENDDNHSSEQGH